MENINKLSEQDLETVAGGTISRDEALGRALDHAQLSRDQLDFVKKVEMDYEHGRKIYEISFYKGGFEFEYDVDAVSGQILKASKEWD